MGILSLGGSLPELYRHPTGSRKRQTADSSALHPTRPSVATRIFGDDPATMVASGRTAPAATHRTVSRSRRSASVADISHRLPRLTRCRAEPVRFAATPGTRFVRSRRTDTPARTRSRPESRPRDRYAPATGFPSVGHAALRWPTVAGKIPTSGPHESGSGRNVLTQVFGRPRQVLAV